MSAPSHTSWFEGVTPYQWRVLFVAWLGWVFDSMDATIYAIVLHPALHDLLHAGPGGPPVSDGDIGWYGGIIFSIFLIGWAIGGVLFGVAADYFGRTKTLIVTILVYAVFTGLAALSETWWHLALYRFLTALGVGGEWAAGASIVAEVWPEEKRAKAAGILQSAWAVGFFLAAAFNLLLSGYGWRILFVVGVAPALVALLVRLWVKEPERWVKAHAQEIQSGSLRGVKLPELFRGDLLRPTLVGFGLAFVAVFGLWGATNWTATLVRRLPDMKGLDAATVATNVSYAIMWLNAGALAGYLSFGPLADRFGRRPVFALMCVGAWWCCRSSSWSRARTNRCCCCSPCWGFSTMGSSAGFPFISRSSIPPASARRARVFASTPAACWPQSGRFSPATWSNRSGAWGGRRARSR